MQLFNVYARNLDGKKRFLDQAKADNNGRGLFTLYADECGDEEEVVISEVTPNKKANQPTKTS